MSFTQAAPVLVTAPIAGLLPDRFDQQHILLAAQITILVAMIPVTVLIAADRIVFWHLRVVSAILGIVSRFDWPS